MNQPTVHYAIIEHADTDGPEVLHLFTTKEERSAKTRDLILGENSEYPCPEITDLEEHGIVTFEGDPGLEWRTLILA